MIIQKAGKIKPFSYKTGKFFNPQVCFVRAFLRDFREDFGKRRDNFAEHGRRQKLRRALIIPLVRHRENELLVLRLREEAADGLEQQNLGLDGERLHGAFVWISIVCPG